MRIESASGVPNQDGWEKVDHVLRIAFDFFRENPEFIRMMRREALDDQGHLGVDLGTVLKPYFERAVGFFDQEMGAGRFRKHDSEQRSEEHTSELQSLMRISYAVFCLKKKKQDNE